MKYSILIASVLLVIVLSGCVISDTVIAPSDNKIEDTTSAGDEELTEEELAKEREEELAKEQEEVLNEIFELVTDMSRNFALLDVRIDAMDADGLSEEYEELEDNVDELKDQIESADELGVEREDVAPLYELLRTIEGVTDVYEVLVEWVSVLDEEEVFSMSDDELDELSNCEKVELYEPVLELYFESEENMKDCTKEAMRSATVLENGYPDWIDEHDFGEELEELLDEYAVEDISEIDDKLADISDDISDIKAQYDIYTEPMTIQFVAQTDLDIILDETVDVSKCSNANAFDEMNKIADLEYETYEGIGAYITSINDVGSTFDEYWMLYVDDEMSLVGISQLELEDGMLMEWRLEGFSF